jgi:D-psicose/D-tagatose/L-ribulose 3-epimerase
MTFSLGISNIAWPSRALEQGLDLACALGLSFVEIAPFAVFGQWDDIDDEASRLREAIERRGLTCAALQGIVYNVHNVELFSSAESRGRLARHFETVARISGILGAKACVYGAPKQRDPGNLSVEAAWAIAVRFLQSVAPLFAENDATLAFEANSRRYGGRFVTTTSEALELVKAVGQAGISLQIDTGTLFLEHEDPAVLLSAVPIASHAHVSEMDLQPPGSTGADHAGVADILRRACYKGTLSIEMRAVEDWPTAVRRAVDLVRRTYL